MRRAKRRFEIDIVTKLEKRSELMVTQRGRCASDCGADTAKHLGVYPMFRCILADNLLPCERSNEIQWTSWLNGMVASRVVRVESS